MTIYKMNEVIWDMANNFFFFMELILLCNDSKYIILSLIQKNISFLFAFYKPIIFHIIFLKFARWVLFDIRSLVTNRNVMYWFIYYMQK